jgi:hypothetical protein
VPRCRRGPAPASRPRPRLEVADIFRAHGAAYRRGHALARHERATRRAIETCRTPERGGHLDVCDACGYARPAYNSCRNRHCPKCEALREARWIAARIARLLPSPYFHVVFTRPAELRPLALRNRRRLFALLFRAASRTLLTLGRDPRRRGARLGVTAVLHTWTRDLQFHPHVHCLVTGGGLAADGTRWIAARRRHLLPVRVLSRLFRGQFLAALTREYTRGRLDLAGACAALADPRAFARLKQQPLPPRLGRLRETPVRRRRAGLPLPRPLYPPRRARQPPPARRRRDGRALRHQARALGAPAARRIHPPLPPPRPPRPLRQDPPRRPLRARPRGDHPSRPRPPPPRGPTGVDAAGGLAHALPPPHGHRSDPLSALPARHHDREMPLPPRGPGAHERAPPWPAVA